jgi:L-alanine-DL-glutamate epimerase-like enolase superfamily enzyme
VPYPRYGETVEGVAAAIEAMRPALERGLTREALQDAMPAGAARNAVDCALWDLDAKRSGVRAHVTAGVDRLRPVTTAYTISLGTPEVMAEAAAKAADRPILKIKLGAPEGDIERIRAVRRAAPAATLIADANEGWTEANLAGHFAACAEAGFALVEQPLPAKADGALAGIARPVPICADESVHDRPSLDRLVGLYDAVNVKLDKTGGLTEALALVEAAEARGLSLMVGCMVGTSLAMAPALVLAPRARFVDLDGPLLLAKDREPGLAYEGSVVHPPAPALWG